MTTITEIGLSVIKHFEQLHDGDLSLIGLQPKMCPAGIWTVGYGRALTDENGRFLKGEKDKEKAYSMYPNLTEHEAENMLFEDTLSYGNKVYRLFLKEKIALRQHEFDALVSFVYNCGMGALQQDGKDKAVLRAIKKGDPEEIKKAFGLWKRGGGKVLPGLVRRRKTEAHLYLTGEVNFFIV